MLCMNCLKFIYKNNFMQIVLKSLYVFFKISFKNIDLKNINNKKIADMELIMIPCLPAILF